MPDEAAPPVANCRVYVGPWRVDVVLAVEGPIPLARVAIARAVARALEAARAPEPGSVTVVLTDDAELADLNEQHMGHEGPTDVLSFPMLEPGELRRAGAAAGMGAPGRGGRSRAAARPRRDPRTHIGDIAISVERAIEQAEQGRGGHTGEVRWAPRDEMLLLVTHGTLHLCGWDHAEPGERAAMQALERRLLAQGG